MQTGIWMTYLDSTHFSDKFSYKILFISSYHLKDINFASFAYLREFLEKQRKRVAGGGGGTFNTVGELSPGR
jgi:hypothetical protein